MLIHAQNVQTQSGVSGSVTTTTVYGYVWWNQAKQNTVTVSGVDTNNPNSNQWASGNTNRTYDANGNLATAVDGATNGVDRTIAYVTNTLGQVLLRSETNSGRAGVRRQFFYLNGRQIGNAGDDGDPLSAQLDDQTDYGKQLADDRINAAQAGTVINANSATPMVLQNAYFDTFEPYDGASVSQSGSTYTVVDGDSLPSIALTLWGDPSLWYVLAEANGLDAGATLTAGMLLTVPGNVTVMHNNSGTYQAYDPANALGNTTPTLPREPQPPAPKQHGCGMVGDIIAIAVSLMVTVYTWGALSGAIGPVLAGAGAVAAGDIAYQGVEIAAGNQSKFNWKELGAAALEGMVEGPLGLVGSNPAKDIAQKVGLWTTVWHAAETSAIHQSANIAVDNQKKFDWTALAVSSVEAGATWGMSHWLDNGHASTSGKPIRSDSARGRILVGAAQVIAGAVTKSVITGQDIGKSAREALPGVIGSTIGQAFVDAIDTARQAAHDLKRGRNAQASQRAVNMMARNPINLDYQLDTSGINWNGVAGDTDNIEPLVLGQLAEDRRIVKSLHVPENISGPSATYTSALDKDGVKGWPVALVGRTPKGGYVYGSATDLVTVDGDIAHPEGQSAGDMTFITGNPLVGFASKAASDQIWYSLDFGDGNVSEWFQAGYNPGSEVRYTISDGSGEVIVKPPTAVAVDPIERFGRGVSVGFVDKLRSDGKAFVNLMDDVQTAPFATAEKVLNAGGELAYRYGSLPGQIQNIPDEITGIVKSWNEFQTARNNGMGTEWVSHGVGGATVVAADAVMTDGGAAFADTAGESALTQAFLRDEAGGGPPLLGLKNTAETAPISDVVPRSPIQVGEITTYQDFFDRSVVGDNLEGHELWQHANLKANSLATSRLSTAASQDNPVIALDRELHIKLNAAQRSLNVATQTPIDNINANAQLLRNLNAAPPETITQLHQMAIKHAQKLGY